jgi:hypothetical protein
MWDKYAPGWRTLPPSVDVNDPKYDHNTLIHHLRNLTDSPNVISHTETDIDKLNFVKRERTIRLRKGRWGKFSAQTENRILADADQ